MHSNDLFLKSEILPNTYLSQSVKPNLLRHDSFFSQIDDEPFNPDYVEVDRVLDVSTGVDQATGAVSMVDLSSHLAVLPARKLIKIFKICVYFQPVSHYLVKWRSLPYDESTWEVEVSFIWSVMDLEPFRQNLKKKLN